MFSVASYRPSTHAQKLCDASRFLCAGVFVLRLFAARAAPVGRKVLERHAVMFSRIVHVAADGTDVFAGRCLEDDFTNRNDGRRIVEIDDALRLKALQRLRRGRAEPDGRTRGAERAAAIERLAGRCLVFIDDGQLVLVESRSPCRSPSSGGTSGT